MVDFHLLEKIIRENNSFLLTTHVNPDADAIGSEIALYFILKELGKEVYIVNHSQNPYNLLFLDTDNRVEKYNPEKHDCLFDKVDVIFALDFNRSDRTVSMAKVFNASDKIKVCIDHHQDPENFADYYFLDPGYSATGHILFDFIKVTDIVKLSYQTAVPIYAAIMTDTGSFRFERTTPEIHRIAAELLEQNVDPSDVYDKLYDQSLFSKLKLLGVALDSLQLYGEKKQIAFMVLTQKMFTETGALESDTEGFVNFSLSVEFVKIGIMFIELKDGFKVSFRSKGIIPVNRLAAEFGGGGHTNASGARILKGNLRDFINIVLERAEKYLEL
jgi:bifunctional oligoribonuclease and PAP phosphatase NrnA